jgi:drug/metabolite transporter (DMT)-like permease
MINKIRIESNKQTLFPLLGIGLMLLVSMLFPFSNSISKHLSATVSVLFIVWGRFFFSSLVTIPLSIYIHRNEFFSDICLGWQVLRTLVLVGYVILVLMAFARIPLADTMAAFFISPIVATILAIFLLKESINRFKVIAVILGFSGTLVLLRPGASFQVGLLFAVAGGFLSGLYLVLTRLVGQTTAPIKTLAMQSMIGAIILTPVILIIWKTPNYRELCFLILAALISNLGHFLLIFAYRLTEASVLSPFGYFEMIGATFVGYLFFNDFPSVMTWIGIVLIVSGGMALVFQNRR